MKHWDTERLLAQYRELARERGERLDSTEITRANRLFDRLTHIRVELRTRGQAYRDGVLELLDDDDPYVRLSACGDVLAFAPDEAVRVLRELLEPPRRGNLTSNARMLLESWTSGEWQPWPP